MLDVVLTAVEEALQYDRGAVARGELWRLVTCHFVHFGFEHFIWDAVVFVVLVASSWRLSPARCLIALAGSIAAIPVVLWMLDPGLQTYRGLSGLDSALFVTLVAGAGRRHWNEKSWPGVAVALVALTALVAKVAFEVVTGQALFVDAGALGFTPVPMAHAAGAAVGGLAALGGGGGGGAPRRPSRGLRSKPSPYGVSFGPRVQRAAAARAGLRVRAGDQASCGAAGFLSRLRRRSSDQGGARPRRTARARSVGHLFTAGCFPS